MREQLGISALNLGIDINLVWMKQGDSFSILKNRESCLVGLEPLHVKRGLVTVHQIFSMRQTEGAARKAEAPVIDCKNTSGKKQAGPGSSHCVEEDKAVTGGEN